MPRTVTAGIRRSAAWHLTVSGRLRGVDQPRDELASYRPLPESYEPRRPSRRDPGQGRGQARGARRSHHHVRVNEPYNRFSGQSLERLTALSDGLFAVAMTLLVLDLRVPVTPAARAWEQGRLTAVFAVAPAGSGCAGFGFDAVLAEQGMKVLDFVAELADLLGQGGQVRVRGGPLLPGRGLLGEQVFFPVAQRRGPLRDTG